MTARGSYITQQVGAIIMKYVAPSAPLTVGGVLDNWIRLFRSSFASCWALALIVAAVGSLLEFMIVPRVPQFHPGGSLPQFYAQYWAAVGGPSIVPTYIAFWLLTLTVYGALLTQQAALVRGEEPFSFGTALSKSVRRLPQMLLGSILVILIVAAFCAPVGIALFVASRHAAALDILLASLASIAAVILFLYVSVRLQFWMAAMFSENLGGAASLGRSWRLAKGHWWRVTGIVFVAGIVMWVLTMTIGVLVGFVVGVMAFHGVTPDVAVRRMELIGALGQVAHLLTMPLLAAVWLAIYQDLRLRREGGDLAARAEALSGR